MSLQPKNVLSKKTVKKTVEETLQIDFPNSYRLNETVVNGKLKNSWFSKPKGNKDEKKLKYRYSPELRELVEKTPWHLIPDEALDKAWKKCFPEEEIESFNDWDNVVAFNGSVDGTSWVITKDTPLSTPFFVDYISGHYRNESYDLVSLLAYLKTHPWVKNAELMSIPYYNCEANSTKAVEFTVRLPQDVSDMLYNKYKGNESWSCRMHEAFCSLYGEDLLGTKQFELKKEQRKEPDYEPEGDSWDY